MLLEEDGQVRVGRGLQERVGARHRAVANAPFADVGVVEDDLCAQLAQVHGDLLGGGAVCVVEVGLVGDSQQQDPRAAGGLAVLVEQGGGPPGDVPGHVGVDPPGEVHHAQGGPGVAGGLRGQVPGEAVTADAGAGAEGVEAERLGLGAADHVPQVDAQVVAERRHLVDQGDVDVPEVGLEQLHRLGLAQAAGAHHPVGDPGVEGEGGLGAGRGEAADHGRGVGGRPGAAAGVHAAGRVGEVEVPAGRQAGTLLQQAAQQALGGPGVDRRLQDHGGVRAQPGGQGAGGGGELRQVEPAVGGLGDGGADDGGADLAELVGAGGGAEAAGQHAAEFGGGQGTGVRSEAVAERTDTGGDGGLGQRQAERSESDDGEICGHGWAVLPDSRRGTGAPPGRSLRPSGTGGSGDVSRCERTVRLGVNMTVMRDCGRRARVDHADQPQE